MRYSPLMGFDGLWWARRKAAGYTQYTTKKNKHTQTSVFQMGFDPTTL
jgi:hypothetical protein